MNPNLWRDSQQDGRRPGMAARHGGQAAMPLHLRPPSVRASRYQQSSQSVTYKCGMRVKAARSLPSSQTPIGLTTTRGATDARSPWASYHPTGNYWLDRPAWELCHIKALRRRDPEPSWYDAQAHDAWRERETRRQDGERLWSLPHMPAEQRQ